MAARGPASQTKAILDRAAELGLDREALPAHVAVIMDGNGRWAKGRGMPRLFGHREGYKALRAVLRAAGDLGVRYFTVYAFSSENWARPKTEVDGLMKLIERAARDELEGLRKNNVRVHTAGRLHEVPEGLRNALEDGVKATAANTGINFTLAVNYGGRAEIVDAVRSLMDEGKSPAEVDEAAISSRLYNPDHPEPDLMIRTAGEMRWSNFLIWQAAYAELVVVDASWPDFSPDRLLDCLLEYQRRTRKFGGLA